MSASYLWERARRGVWPLAVGAVVAVAHIPEFAHRLLDGDEAIYGSIAVLMNMGGDLYGSGGVENAMDTVLNGSDGQLFVRRISDLITGREPNGGNVELTINPAVQKAAYDGLTRKGYTGAVVAIRPSTGEILAMVTTPSYDPNRLSSHAIHCSCCLRKIATFTLLPASMAILSLSPPRTSLFVNSMSELPPTRICESSLLLTALRRAGA